MATSPKPIIIITKNIWSFMQYKQPLIVQELKKRIASGAYAGTLPTTLELAAEFDVNPKTMNKAMAQLVSAGLLERRKRSGTRVRTGSTADGGEQLVEVIFEGFSSIFSHPFWGVIWSSMVETLAAAGFRTVLNLLESEESTGLLKLDRFSMSASAGKILLGVNEQKLLDQVKKSGVPCIAACDPVEDAGFAHVTFDFTDGIRDAVDFLIARGRSRIAFIGQTQSYVNLIQLHKYNSYLKAIQKYHQIDPALIENVRPLEGLGAPALANILKRTVPDALIAAYDHQLPAMYRVLAEHGLELPVIGCDGLSLPQLPADRPVIFADRRLCGTLTAQNMVAAMASRRKPRSQTIPAEFRAGSMLQ
jgi:DNA-binding LacI/PurR family transcriptional regulator